MVCGLESSSKWVVVEDWAVEHGSNAKSIIISLGNFTHLIRETHYASNCIYITLNCLSRLGELCKFKKPHLAIGSVPNQTALTLNIRNSLVQDLLLDRGVLQILLDLLDQESSQLLLLTLTELGFVTNPRVKSGLDFGSNSNLLLQFESLSFDLGGLAGEFEQSLGDVHKVLHLTDLVNALLNGSLVFNTSVVQNRLDALYPQNALSLVTTSHYAHQLPVYLDVLVGHVGVGLTKVLQQNTEQTGGGDQDQSFLVQDVNLLGDQGGSSATTNGQVSGLGGDRVTGKRVKNRRLLGGYCVIRLNTAFSMRSYLCYLQSRRCRREH